MSATRSILRCAECGGPMTEDERDASRICENCLMAHYQEAHQLLYGHEECRNCGAVLVCDWERESGTCDQCEDSGDLEYD